MAFLSFSPRWFSRSSPAQESRTTSFGPHWALAAHSAQENVGSAEFGPLTCGPNFILGYGKLVNSTISMLELYLNGAWLPNNSSSGSNSISFLLRPANLMQTVPFSFSTASSWLLHYNWANKSFKRQSNARLHERSIFGSFGRAQKGCEVGFERIAIAPTSSVTSRAGVFM